MESSDIHDIDKARKWQLDTHQTKISDENSDLCLVVANEGMGFLSRQLAYFSYNTKLIFEWQGNKVVKNWIFLRPIRYRESQAFIV